jgi:hypothetical protein
MFEYEGRSGIFRRSLRLVTDREDGAIENKETTTIEDRHEKPDFGDHGGRYHLNGAGG